MNYYIQGDAANAANIKAAFEKLGYDVTGFDMCNDNVLFFTYKSQTGANVISTTNAHLYTANIIKTHPDYKELELTVKPKFKVGDKVFFGTLHETIAVVLTNEQRYLCDTCREILFEVQDRWHLAPKPHYDISNFHAGMPVLVRADNVCRWDYSVFSRITGNEGWPFAVCNGVSFSQCIPFNDDTKHLLGTTDMPDEMYINW